MTAVVIPIRPDVPRQMEFAPDLKVVYDRGDVTLWRADNGSFWLRVGPAHEPIPAMEIPAANIVQAHWALTVGVASVRP